MISNFSKFLDEALTIKQYRKYHKEAEKFAYKERYKEIFNEYKEKYSGDKNAYRIYLPLDVKILKSPIQHEVEKVLRELGVDVDDKESFDYIAGNFRYPVAKNWTKIGKALSKVKRQDLGDKFASDPSRALRGKKSDLMVCISRHPYDVVGADTGRNWWNCMTLFHYNKYKNAWLSKGGSITHLLSDVRRGSIVSYLIKDNDKNIQDPLANISIKPHINEKDPKDIVLIPDNRIYGLADEDFKRTVYAWCDEINGNKIGYYKLAKGLYQDNFRRIEDGGLRFAEEDWQDEDPYQSYAKKYLPKNERLSDLILQKDPEVTLEDFDFKELPIEKQIEILKLPVQNEKVKEQYDGSWFSIGGLYDPKWKCQFSVLSEKDIEKFRNGELEYAKMGMNSSMYNPKHNIRRTETFAEYYSPGTYID